MTGEAIDLVARLRDMDSGLSHAVWDRGCQSCALNSNTLNEAATLIEAQAAEIEEATSLLSGLLDEAEDVFVCMADATGIDRHNFPAAFVKARAFLASRTERAAIETTRAGSTLSVAERTNPHSR